MLASKGFSRSRSSGFSLIEIMVVLVIIGLLAAIVAPNVIGVLGDSRAKKARADFANIENALKMYKLDNFIYPTTEQGLFALVAPPDVDPARKNWRKDGYLSQMPKDPWGNPYEYESPAENGRGYDIFSLGADGQVGGEEEAMDLSIWDGADDLN